MSECLGQKISSPGEIVDINLEVKWINVANVKFAN
jgi:hypothetical protein